MPVEPEHLIYRFPHRARRWQRLLGYSRVDCQAGRELCIVRYQAKAENLAAIGRKIVFLSDLHFRDRPDQQRRLAEAIELIKAFSPDYLVTGGDLIGHASDIRCLPAALQQLSQAAPVRLAVLGNWETAKIWLSPEYWRNFYRDNGIQLLENEFFDDGVCCFYGAGYLPAGRVTLPSWPDDGPRARVLFAHSPDTVICFDSGSVSSLPPLSVCGHTHGGQVRLPGLGALYSSSIYGRRFDYGLFQRLNGDQQMIITSGLENCSFPWRCRCRRELVFITFI